MPLSGWKKRFHGQRSKAGAGGAQGQRRQAMADFLRWASGYKSDANPTAFSLTPGESRDEPLLWFDGQIILI